MKVRTLVAFKDRRQKKIRKVGEVFECSEERYQEIRNVGEFIEAVEPASKPKNKTRNAKKENAGDL